MEQVLYVASDRFQENWYLKQTSSLCQRELQRELQLDIPFDSRQDALIIISHIIVKRAMPSFDTQFYWSLEKIIDSDSLWDDIPDEEWTGFVPDRITKEGKHQKLNKLTTSLIYLMPIAHIEEITPENFPEVFILIRMLDIAAQGRVTDQYGYQTRISLQDIKRHIGLHVSVDKPEPPFANWLYSNLNIRAIDDYENEKRSN